MVGTELLSQPLGARHAARGEGLWAGSALRRLVAAEQFVDMFEAHLRGTVQHTSAVYLAPAIGHSLLFCTQRVPRTNALLIAKATGRLNSAYHRAHTGTTTPHTQQHTSSTHTE